MAHQVQGSPLHCSQALFLISQGHAREMVMPSNDGDLSLGVDHALASQGIRISLSLVSVSFPLMVWACHTVIAVTMLKPH